MQQELASSDVAASTRLHRLRATIRSLERQAGNNGATCAGAPSGPRLRFGIEAIDDHLPAGGLSPGLHEIAGRGRDLAAATAPALLAASLMAASPDPHAPVLWAVERRDLFAPGLAGTGLAPERLLLVDARGDTLAVMEEAARTTGLAGVVGELGGALTLTASRRLQLAAEEAGVPVLAIRRPCTAARPGTVSVVDTPNAAATRWRIACLPSRPPDPIEAGSFSMTFGRALWRLDLVRARGGAPSSWIVEAFDEAGRLALPSAPRHRSGAAPFQRGVWAAGDLVA